MKFGIDRLLAEPDLRRPLEGKRVALVAHPASVTADLTHSLPHRDELDVDQTQSSQREDHGSDAAGDHLEGRLRIQRTRLSSPVRAAHRHRLPVREPCAKIHGEHGCDLVDLLRLRWSQLDGLAA